VGGVLYQFAGDGDRPTYFEMLAAEQLPASLKAALLYVMRGEDCLLFPPLPCASELPITWSLGHRVTWSQGRHVIRSPCVWVGHR